MHAQVFAIVSFACGGHMRRLQLNEPHVSAICDRESKLEPRRQVRSLAAVLFASVPNTIARHSCSGMNCRCVDAMMTLENKVSTSPRSYVANAFFGNLTERNPLQRLEDQIAEERKLKEDSFYFGGAFWSSYFYRFGLVGSSYLGYPFLAEFLSLFPKLEIGGPSFISILSITFATLVAATVADASSRLAGLRAVAVEEISVMLAFVTELEDVLAEGTEVEQSLLRDCLTQVWEHTNLLIKGSREEELKCIASGDDCLVKLLLYLRRSKSMGGDLEFAVGTARRLVEMRGRRLSLEVAGVPKLQIGWLRITSVAICIIFAYITLGYEWFTASGIDLNSWLDPYVFLSLSFPQRVTFAYLVSVLSFSVNLADDLNQPFDGYFRIESLTMIATLVRLRTTMAKYLGLSLDSGFNKEGRKSGFW